MTSAARYIDPRAQGMADEPPHDLGLEAIVDQSGTYSGWIVDACRPHLGPRVLEVGAGHGALTRHYEQGRSVVATDVSESCLEALRDRFDTAPNVTVRSLDIRHDDPGGPFDSVLLVNVLEHIEDDAAALSALAESLEPGGTVLVYVPALDWCYSRHDRNIGHFRRYVRPRLQAVFDEAGLETVEIRYMNMLAIVPWFVVARVLRLDPGLGGSVGIWDRTGAVATRWIEDRVRVPLGLNLLGVARRPLR